MTDSNDNSRWKWPPSFGQSLVYGAAVGLLMAIVFRPFESQDEQRQIEIWRNFLLGGACAGIMIRAVWMLKR